MLSGGACRIRIQVKDELSGESAARELTFVVSGPKIAPSPSLAIRGLNFYRNDEDERPLDVAAFRASEEIHARFQLVGYRHNERNAIDVAYGISIADASGNVLFAEPSAAQDKSEDFYPKPYVPGILSFTLKPGDARRLIHAHGKGRGSDRRPDYGNAAVFRSRMTRRLE